MQRMTDKFYKTGTYKTEIFDKEHRHPGGRIYPSDFYTNYRGKENTNGSTIASRIASDFRWEKNSLTRENKDEYGRTLSC